MTDVEGLRRAMEALEAQRPVLGDAVVDAALGSIRAQLQLLEGSVQIPPTGANPTVEPSISVQAGDDSQLKYISVLFTDIVGSTQMGQRLDPEDILEIMDGALRRFEMVIERYGGRVLRFMGDGLKAVFGTPMAREDDAARAVRAGLALLEEAGGYAQQVEAVWGLSGFNIRVGVNTGPVILGGGVEAGNTAMGMTINMAARLEASAPVGGLLISQDTHQHVRGLFDVQGQPPLKVKGRDEPLKTYLVLRPSSRRVPARGLEGVETRLIGREGELGRLQGLFEEAVQRGETQVVTLAGEPGIGKTRLLDVFDRWLALPAGVGLRLRGEALQETAAIPYALLRSLLAHRFEIADSDSAAEARRKLETGLVEFLPDEPEMKAHFIGALIGLDFSTSPHLQGVADDPAQIRQRARFYLLQFISGLAQRAPVVLSFEDIHWADESSLDVLQQLAREHPHLPLLIICLARPTLLEDRPKWEQREAWGEARYSRIDLQPLDAGSCRRLAEEILQRAGPVPEILIERLVSSAEGNPYYVEEFVRVLIADGVIVRGIEGEPWRVDPDRLRDLRVPPTLTAVLQARLDGLPAAEKRALQMAAVVGRVFWDAAVAALQAGDGGPEAPFHRLAARDLIVSQDHSAFIGCQEYAFQHALLHEVTYGTVLKGSRQAYHARAAAWLAETTGAQGRSDEFAAVIGDHYARARLDGDATGWYLRAGERALAQAAPGEARRFFDLALDRLPADDTERRWRALLGRDDALGILGEAEARQAADAALLQMAQDLGDKARLAQAFYRVGYYASVTGHLQRELEAFEASLLNARQAGDERLEILILALRVISLARFGRTEAATADARQALDRAEAFGDERVLERVLANIAVFFTELGDIAFAARLLQRQAQLSHRLGDRMGEAVGLTNLGYDYVQLGLFRPGRLALEKAVLVTESIGARLHRAYAGLNLGLALWRSGEVQAAMDTLERTLPALADVGDPFGHAAGQTYLGLALETAGDPTAAAASFEAGSEALLQLGAQGYARDARAGLIRARQAVGDQPAARRHANRLWNELQAHGSRGMELPILAYQTCARVFAAAGEREEALRCLEAGRRDLLERASRISDPSWRESFLGNIPEHREIVAAIEKS